MPALSRLVRIGLILALTLATWLAGCRRVEQPREWPAPHEQPLSAPQPDKRPFERTSPDRVRPKQTPAEWIVFR